MPKWEVQLLRATVEGEEPSGTRHPNLELLETRIVEAASCIAARNVMHDDLAKRKTVPDGALFVFGSGPLRD